MEGGCTRVRFAFSARLFGGKSGESERETGEIEREERSVRGKSGRGSWILW